MKEWTVEKARLSDAASVWDALHRASQGTVFTSTAWLNLFAQIHGREVHLLLLKNHAGVQAGIPLLLKKKGILRYAGRLPMSVASGILRIHTAAISTAAYATLFSEAGRYCHYITLALPDDTQLNTVLSTCGWGISYRKSLQLSIDNTDLLWNGYSQSLRRKIRRASEASLTFSDDISIQLLTALYVKSYARHGLHPPIAPERMSDWLSRLQQQGSLHCFAALSADGSPAAARALLRDGEHLYDWLAGVDPATVPSASHWLLHNILLRFSREGVRSFDFMGANTPGVVDFKRSFGANEYSYFEAEWYRSSIIRSLIQIQTKRLQQERQL